MDSALSSYFSGFGLGASLIIAIGAQNAFVLVQGIRRNHHFKVALLCAFIDVALITVGVLGVGSLVASNKWLRLAAGIGGGLFLLVFGFNALRLSRQNQAMTLANDGEGRKSLKKTLLTTLAISLLNPHVYLDTVVMLGAISSNFPGDSRYLFGFGACTASVVWFFSLAQGGRMLAPVFARPTAWRVLNLVVCLMVWVIALALFRDAWQLLRGL